MGTGLGLLLLVGVHAVHSVSPVVIIPGDGSNQLEARLNKPSAPHLYCSRQSGWFRLWLNLEIIVPGVIDCWCDNIMLQVNASTGHATNRPGVSVRVPGFGSTEGMEELDPAVGAKTGAFLQLVTQLVQMGYVRNDTLRGAPYDFRYTPDTDASYGDALAQLVESTVNRTGSKVVLVSHSMGGLQTLYFLNSRAQTWKDRYVKHWIAISAPFGGAAKEMRLFASGDAEGLPVNPLTIRAEQRSYETNHWLLPVKSVWGDTALVQTADRNYTAADLGDFFGDIEYPTGRLVFPRVAGLIPDPSKGPGVAVSCLYSKGVGTPLRFQYSGSFDKQPVSIAGDGDGTVNLRSLMVCDGWNQTQPQSVDRTVLEGIDHQGMITSDLAIKTIKQMLSELSSN